MRITRVITKQGHPVPSHSHSPRGPFPPEIFKDPEITTEYESFDDDNPVGSTAQNDFKSPKVFKCSVCSVVVYEHEIPSHVCSEADELDGTYA